MLDSGQVVRAIAARPGRTRRAVAEALPGRLTTALGVIDTALDQDRVHYRAGTVTARAGRPRSVQVLHPGPAPAARERPTVAASRDPGYLEVDRFELRSLRQTVKVSQAALGMWLGVSAATVSQWESGAREIPPAMSRLIDDALAREVEDRSRAQLAGSVGRSRNTPPSTLVADLVANVRARPGATPAQITQGSARRATALAWAESHGLVERRRHTGRRTEGLHLTVEDDVDPYLDAPVQIADLVAARRRAAWSRGDLAKALGISLSSVHAWEQNAGADPSALVPAWALPLAHGALRTAEQAAAAAADDVEHLVQLVEQSPGLPRRDVLAALGLDDTARRGRGRRLVALAASNGRLHATGDLYCLHAGAAGAGSGLESTRGRPRHSRPRSGLSAETMRTARERAGLSQERLAQRLTSNGQPVVRTTIARWERLGGDVPSWAVPTLATVLADLDAAPAPTDTYRTRLLEIVENCPGLSPTQVLARFGASVHANAVRALLLDLEQRDLVHRQHVGQRGRDAGLFPGPPPDADLLSAEQLRQRRASVGWTQAQLAAAASLHEWQITYWESGRHPIPREHQQYLLDVLERQPSPDTALDTAVLEAIGQAGCTRHHLEQLHLAARSQVDASLFRLVQTHQAHRGRLAPQPTVDARGRTPQGRIGYLPGPPQT